MDKLYDLNKNWLLISGNDDETDYHQTRIDENKAYKAVTPSFPHMYIEDHTGITWYQQEFFLEELPDKDHIAMVAFERATLKTDVSVNGKMVGTHIGNEDPFKFDVTDALKKGDNIICVRTSKPDTRDIDGYNFFEIPHRNETAEGLMPGANFNISGIYGDVWLKVIPKVYIDDVYLIPDHKTGNIQVRMTVINKYNDKKKVDCFVKAGKTTDGYTTEINSVTALTNPGETLVTTDITIDNYELWSTENPILYNVYTEIKTDCTEQSLITRTGFRYFEIRDDGYFYLNGKRIMLKGSHTGNFAPYSTQNIYNDEEFLRKDFMMAKALGFNMVRFISGVAVPMQLDLADEIGLMIYEEPRAGWQTRNGVHAKELYLDNHLTMIKRDSNHPSVTIWGFLNETKCDGNSTDLFEVARDSLPAAREIDETRLIMFSSGRWDYDLSLGSFSNPYSRKWDCVLNGDGLDCRCQGDMSEYEGLQSNEPHRYEPGDIHIYCLPKLNANITARFRQVGVLHKRPYFLSEFGIGSALDTTTLINKFEEEGGPKICPDVKMIYQMDRIFRDELKKYGFDKLYPLATTLFKGSYNNHAKYRMKQFNIVRSNPYLNAMSITGLLDHSICGEGLWTIYRKYKPYMADVMQMGFSDAMWCIITPKASVNKGEEFSVEALISSVDVLKTGKTYPARLSIEKDGVTYAYREYSVTVPDSNSFVIPVLNEKFDTSSYPEGEYTLHLEIDGCDVCNNTKKFTVINPVMSKTKRKVLCIDIDEEMFTQYGFKIAKRYSEGAIVAVRSVTKKNFKKIQEYLSKGATVVCFKATADDDISVNLLPKNRRPGKVLTNDWLYHKEYVVNYESPFFDRMPAGVMDCDLCGDFFNHYSLDAEGEAVPDITHAMSFCTGYPVKSGYTGGFSMGTYNLECGRLVLNTFDLLESELPYAKKIFVNMIDNA